MKERDRAKFEAKQAERKALERKPRERPATREEQRARYLDCGPLAWDDIDGEG